MLNNGLGVIWGSCESAADGARSFEAVSSKTAIQAKIPGQPKNQWGRRRCKPLGEGEGVVFVGIATHRPCQGMAVASGGARGARGAVAPQSKNHH